MMKRILFSVMAATALAAAALAPSGASAQGAADGTTLLHGIPATPVDVYVDGTATFVDFQPGATQDVTSLAGTTLTNVEIFAAGDDPASDTPLLTAATLAIPASGNNTIVVHLDEAGAPTVTTFVNNATETGSGVGRVTVRHTAAAPAVDLVLSASGDRPVLNLNNGDSQEFGPAVGSYDLQLAAAGSGVIPGTQVSVQVNEGENLIVYAVGSVTGTIEYYTETIDVGVVAAATTTTDPNATTTTSTTLTSTTTTTTSTSTTTTAAVPVAVNTGSPLDSPLSPALIAIALGALVVTGGAILARRRL